MADNEFDEADDPSRNPDPFPASKIIRTGKPERWKHEADTRRWIAYVIVFAIVVFNGAVLGDALWGTLSVDDAMKVIGMLSPLQSLAAATIGFFFARPGKRK